MPALGLACCLSFSVWLQPVIILTVTVILACASVLRRVLLIRRG